MSAFTLQQFLRYYWRAATIYNTDSPFIYDFYTNVLNDDRQFYAFGWIDSYRQTLLHNTASINVSDFGAGSQRLATTSRRIADIAQTSVSPRWQGEFLFRLVNWLQPTTKLEIGTSLGITTLYQYFPNTQSQFYTLEGCPQIANIAQQQFQKYPNAPQTVVGNFDETLAPTLERLQRLDYAFIDGNHRLEATLRYVNACLPYTHENSVLVLDDIYWSPEMRQAWQQVRQLPNVTLSIDLFKMGLIFFRPTHTAPQHYTLIPYRFKPWRIGLWR